MTAREWIGTALAVAGLVFGGWQYVIRQSEERGAERELVRQLNSAILELKTMTHEDRQLLDDARVRLATIEAYSRSRERSWR